jgi:IS1 family transposase
MKEVHEDNRDGLIWKCSRTIDGARHFSALSIRNGSIFSDSHLPIREIIYLIYEWSIGTSCSQVAYQLDLHEKTVQEWFGKCRHIAGTFVESSQSIIIGGEGTTVEIDECQIGRRKHNHGRISREIWIFGAVERGSNPLKCFIEIVANRNRRTLTEIINRRIAPTTHIISDGWGAYSNLNQASYTHSVVNHSENFLNPTNPNVHTQNIENLWRCFRRFLNAKGTQTRRHLSEYIREFIFRKLATDSFEIILSEIERMYMIDH